MTKKPWELKKSEDYGLTSHDIVNSQAVRQGKEAESKAPYILQKHFGIPFYLQQSITVNDQRISVDCTSSDWGIVVEIKAWGQGKWNQQISARSDTFLSSIARMGLFVKGGKKAYVCVFKADYRDSTIAKFFGKSYAYMLKGHGVGLLEIDPAMETVTMIHESDLAKVDAPLLRYKADPPKTSEVCISCGTTLGFEFGKKYCPRCKTVL